MQQILKANELPPGARMMGRQGRALTGMELAEGLAGLVAREVDELAGQSCLGQAKGQWWYGLHLTFPRARVEWVTCKEGIWIKLLLGTGKEWEFRWQDRDADIRNMREIGPFASPDDFREALGLARIAQFKLPGGDVVTAELPGSFLKPMEPKREDLVRVAKEVEEGSEMHEIGAVRGEIEAVIERGEVSKSEVAAHMIEQVGRSIKVSTDGVYWADAVLNSVSISESELLAEPPLVEPSEPVVMKAKPVGAALKGGKKKK